MKKFIILIMFLTLSINGFSQDSVYGLRVYVSPYFNYSRGSAGFCTEMCFEDFITPSLLSFVSTGLYYSPMLDRACGTYFSAGIKYNPADHIYAVVDLKPIVRLNGVGHQVYGDYLTFGVTTGVGLGGYVRTGHGLLFAEVKLCSDIIIYTELDNRTSLYMFAAIGYRYRML